MKALIVFLSTALLAGALTAQAGYSNETITTPQGNIYVTYYTDGGPYITADYRYPDGTTRHCTGYRYPEGDVNWNCN
jgi:hypothetical protein